MGRVVGHHRASTHDVAGMAQAAGIVIHHARDGAVQLRHLVVVGIDLAAQRTAQEKQAYHRRQCQRRQSHRRQAQRRTPCSDGTKVLHQHGKASHQKHPQQHQPHGNGALAGHSGVDLPAHLMIRLIDAYPARIQILRHGDAGIQHGLLLGVDVLPHILHLVSVQTRRLTVRNAVHAPKALQRLAQGPCRLLDQPMDGLVRGGTGAVPEGSLVGGAIRGKSQLPAGDVQVGLIEVSPRRHRHGDVGAEAALRLIVADAGAQLLPRGVDLLLQKDVCRLKLSIVPLQKLRQGGIVVFALQPVQPSRPQAAAGDLLRRPPGPDTGPVSF